MLAALAAAAPPPLPSPPLPFKYHFPDSLGNNKQQPRDGWGIYYFTPKESRNKTLQRSKREKTKGVEEERSSLTPQMRQQSKHVSGWWVQDLLCKCVCPVWEEHTGQWKPINEKWVNVNEERDNQKNRGFRLQIRERIILLGLGLRRIEQLTLVG